MKNCLAAILFCFLSTLVMGQQTSETLKVQGSKILTPCGEEVIIRGVNEMFVWSTDRTGEKILPEIKQTGANTVRLVWTKAHGTPGELDQLISNTISHGIIPMPELHDATGDLSKVPELVDYWVSEEMLAVLLKHQNYILLNIANEPGDGSETEAQFLKVYKDAITKFREHGVKCPLVIDAPGWNQNIDMLQSAWKELQAHDPEHNLVFSVHTWWIKDENSDDPNSTNRIKNELTESVSLKMPLIVGEFAPMGVACARGFDYETLMAECQKYNIGWMTWSWGWANNGDCSEMDMTNDGKFGNWQGVEGFGKWGEQVTMIDPNSISKTATYTDYIREYGNDSFTCDLFEFTYSTVLSASPASDLAQVYPNPFSGLMKIEATQNTDFKVYNLSGMIVESGKCHSSCEVGGELTKGIYIVELKDGQDVLKEKMVKR